MRFKSPFVLVALVAAGLTASPQSVQAQPAGKITGKIFFKGVAPDPIKIRMSADPRCMKGNPEGAQRKQIDGVNGGLAGVIVSIKSPVKGTFPAKTAPVLLDQVGCMYTPTTIALQVGQPLTMRNSDETLHNIHPRPTINAGFNVGQPRKGMETVKTFDKPETFFPVGCDVHPWMFSYVSVLEHPFYAVTSEDGRFEIKGLPDGKYKVKFKHRKAGEKIEEVEIKDGAATVDIVLAVPAA